LRLSRTDLSISSDAPSAKIVAWRRKRAASMRAVSGGLEMLLPAHELSAVAGKGGFLIATREIATAGVQRGWRLAGPERVVIRA